MSCVNAYIVSSIVPFSFSYFDCGQDSESPRQPLFTAQVTVVLFHQHQVQEQGRAAACKHYQGPDSI